VREVTRGRLRQGASGSFRELHTGHIEEAGIQRIPKKLCTSTQHTSIYMCWITWRAPLHLELVVDGVPPLRDLH